MAADPAVHADDFFKLPDSLNVANIKIPAIVKDYAHVAEDFWIKIPALWQEYSKLVKENWNTYTETYIKRFENLPSGEQRKFLNSGLDGAVMFLLFAMLSRMFLSRVIEPYIGHYYIKKREDGSWMTFMYMKWMYTSLLLFSVWHLNSHYFFDYGAAVDISGFISIVACACVTIYRKTMSPAACVAFLIIPFLVLAPLAATVAIMQNGPYITEPRTFPYFLALMVAATATYFIVEAPSTPVLGTCSQTGKLVEVPYWDALQEEMADLWEGDWRSKIGSAPGQIARSIVHSPRTFSRKVKDASSKMFKASANFVKQEEADGKKAVEVKAAVNPIFNFLEALVLFILGVIYRINKFFCYVYRLILNAVMKALTQLPGMSEYLGEENGKIVDHTVPIPRLSRRTSRNRSGTSARVRLSRRVSKPRKEEDENNE